ncbi:MAG: LPS export ABC transporter periplasmic protein LptC [Bacteroidales bacterium]|nr:LPS export ABC transporter periplasmic protein LptC [Bacteroidales bacterium]
MTSRGLRLLPSALLLTSALMTACGGSEPTGRDIGDSRRYPTMATTDVATLISDSGYTRYHITAPRWLMFEEADTPYWSFPDGVYMEQYDDSMTITATFQADSATYLSARKIWQFDGRVNMRNSDGDRFATSQLFWDQNKREVYSDSFMHIDRNSRIIEGYGFESNEQFTEYTIRRPQMSLPVERAPRARNQDSTATEVPAQSAPSTVAESPAKPDPALKRLTDTIAKKDVTPGGEMPRSLRPLRRDQIKNQR